jgi:1,4-dihydroxy-2-naphthoate octaprenyltransferase
MFMETLRLFFRLSRPLFLLGVAVLYALGVGIAHYLGFTVQWSAYLLGQAWVAILQLGTQYLNEYFNAPADFVNQNRTLLTGGSGALGPGKLPRRVALWAALTCLATLASLTVLLLAEVQPSAVAVLIMGGAFLGAFFYSTPPARLEGSGYGELIASVLVGFLVPLFAFLLQAGEIHRLVAMSAFPLVALHMAMVLALELPDYANDLRYDKRTLMVRIGWERGMRMHNILIVTAFLLIILAWSFGYPRFATIAGLLPFPIGIFQMVQMRNIANGGKPNWTALTVGAVGLLMTMAYIMALAFWTH